MGNGVPPEYSYDKTGSVAVKDVPSIYTVTNEASRWSDETLNMQVDWSDRSSADYPTNYLIDWGDDSDPDSDGLPGQTVPATAGTTNITHLFKWGPNDPAELARSIQIDAETITA
jgi:hypothetical protein